MMDCKKLREVLDAYADRELSVDATAQAEAHIAECSACRRAVENLARLRGSQDGGWKTGSTAGTHRASPQLGFTSMASGHGHPGNCGYLGSRGSIDVFPSQCSGGGSHRAGLLVSKARRDSSSCLRRNTGMPGLPAGKTIRLPCHVSTDWTSRLASNERRAALGYPRRECLS